MKTLVLKYIFVGVQRAVPLLLVINFMIIGCSQQPESAGGPPMMKTNVVGFKTVQKDLMDSISLIGTLQADEFVEIKSEISGTVKKVLFKEGQKVKKGDVLIEIEESKLQASFDQAKANLNLSKTTTERYKKLINSNAISQQEYDEALAQLESNQAQLKLAEEQLEDATITAAFDGVMGERLVSAGQYISQGTSLTELFSQDPMKVQIHVPERYLGNIEEDQVVELKVDAYKDNLYEGKVYFIDPRINEATRSALVKAYIDNPDGKLKEGMFAHVDLIINVDKNALVIPETALIIKGDTVSVYVVNEDDTAGIAVVKVGTRMDGMVVIKEGLEKDDVVITEGYQKIGPGSPVNVRLEEMSDKKFYEII